MRLVLIFVLLLGGCAAKKPVTAPNPIAPYHPAPAACQTCVNDCNSCTVVEQKQ